MCSLLSRCVKNLVWQEELLDAIHWMRQVLAIVVGVIFGLVPMKGLNAILMCAPGSPLNHLHQSFALAAFVLSNSTLLGNCKCQPRFQASQRLAVAQPPGLLCVPGSMPRACC